MSLHFYSLASGSSGNAMLMKTDHAAILIDAGMPITRMCNALQKFGLRPDLLNAIFLTHEHSDHTAALAPLLRRGPARIYTNQATWIRLNERTLIPDRHTLLETGSSIQIEDILIKSFAVSHDAAEPVGYTLEAEETRITYATDLGHVTPEIEAELVGSSLIVLESNHDRDWLMRGSYTAEMKARIDSNRGHLSNLACAEALCRRLQRGSPCCAWLAHLSASNNSPSLALRSVKSYLASQNVTCGIVEVAQRDQPSLYWTPGMHAVQRNLF